jgi:hypothetical protein
MFKLKLGILPFVFCLCMTPLSISAQSYGTALGIRLDGWGATLQQQIAVGKTIEIIVQSEAFSKNSMIATALFEQHKGLLTQNLNFYVGGGLFHKWYDKSDVAYTNYKNATGISPIMGLELNLGKLVFSGDIKPNIKVSGDGKGWEWHTGISVRYELHGRYFKNEDWKFWQKWKKKKK